MSTTNESHGAEKPAPDPPIIKEDSTEVHQDHVPKQETALQDVEKGGSDSNTISPGSDEEVANPPQDGTNVVWWENDEDPENPQNWPGWRKYVNCSLISFLTFLTPLASSMFAPGVPQLMREFKSANRELAAFVVSVYVLGFAFGPLLMAPLSEIYGRMPVYNCCNLLFVIFLVACALAPTLESLIVFRFLSGTFGACPLTNGGGSIADMISQEQRAAAMAAFSIGPLLGPIIGPVIGGVVADTLGWRWVFWLLAIFSGALFLLMLLAMRETYAPTILQGKTLRLQKETGNSQLRSKLDSGLSSKDHFKRGIVRPLRLLLFSPICTIFAVYMAVVYGYLYLLFTSVTFVFQQYYSFTTSTVGLVYLGLGVGSLGGMFWFAWDGGRAVKKNMEGGQAKPEIRLKLLPHGAILLPIGFFIYGWTAHYHQHWMAPIIGTTVIGVGE
jgi:multidrug resistance protein